MFRYLKDHKRSKVVFDPTCVDINGDYLLPEDKTINRAKFVSGLYLDTVEGRPNNKPPPRGQNVYIPYFVDANYYWDQVIRRSRTGILIYVNKTPIVW